MCRRAMGERISSCIGTHGEEGAVSTKSLVAALKATGFLNEVWESAEVWELRMEWLEGEKDDLALVWDANLTFRFKDQLNLSYDKVDQLRYCFSHHRVGKRLVPRTWARN